MDLMLRGLLLGGMTSRTPSASGRVPAGLARAALPCVFALLVACGGGDEPAPQARPVIVEALATGHGQARERTYPGRVEAAEGTQLAFQVDGRIARLHVADGARVRRGDVLAELDASPYEVSLREATVNERTAAADLERRRALQAEGILAPAAVEQAEAQLASARAAREGAALQVGYTRLRAPYDGIVARRHAEAGVVVPAGQPVFTMQDAGVVDVAVNLPERDASLFRFGPDLAGTATLPARPDMPPLALTYREHATVPEDGARSYRLVLRGSVPESGALLPGMALRVALPDPAPATLEGDQAWVRLAAVLSDEHGGATVWTVDDEDRAQPVAVEVVRIEGDRALIRSDLADGVPVVVAGARLLEAGQPVRPQERR